MKNTDLHWLGATAMLIHVKKQKPLRVGTCFWRFTWKPLAFQELDVNELVLLLDKNYQKFFKQINLDTINVSGEYTQNNFSINNLELNFNENSQLKFSGLINLENFLNSKLNIKGFNIPFEVFSQFLQNINFLNSTKLPKGNLDNFDIQNLNLAKL